MPWYTAGITESSCLAYASAVAPSQPSSPPLMLHIDLLAYQLVI